MTSGLLGYVLESTGDTRDRSGEIEAILEEKGCCILGIGDFFVSGVNMPAKSTLMGLGERSVLVLSPEVEEGTAVKMGTCCRVENLSIAGSLGDLGRPAAVGTRHGLGFVGDGDPKTRLPQIKYGIAANLHIYNFSGGGVICNATGFSCDSSLTASGLRIHSCGVGIYIPYFSEYHKFTGALCTRNIYGCINNGGNNVFTACSFDGNKIGFLIDNSDKKACNNSHGTAVACTFNHSDSNKGIGIQVLGASHGYVFSACQLFFSQIVVEDSLGVQFVDFNCGKDEKITVRGGGMVRFSGCSFSKPPVLTVEDNPFVRWENCYDRHGEELKFDEVKV